MGYITAIEYLIDRLGKIAEEQNVTLLYAAKDESHNHAIVLKDFIEEYAKNLDNGL